LVDIGATAEIRLSTSNILVHQDSAGAGRTATATFNATNIILSRTKTGSGQNIDLIRKAHA
jgi:protein tyrosine phosphatase